jgi:hypothetical protein
MEQPAVPGPETVSTSATDPDELLALFVKWQQPGTDLLPGMKIEELW